MDTVGSRLRSLREGVGLTQKRMSELLKATQSSVNRYETGNAEAPYRVLSWYADYFDVSLDYIFGRTDEPRGKLYDYRPEALKEQTAKDEELRQFVDMCFDPSSPMSGRLKEVLVKMLKEGDDARNC